MNKYQYFVNGDPISRKEFVNKLQECCQKWISTTETPLGGIDIMEPDDKLFKKKLRDIENGAVIIIGRDIFRRKEM